MDISILRREWVQRQGFVYRDPGYYDLLDIYGKPVFSLEARLLKIPEYQWVIVQGKICFVIEQLGGTVQ